MIYNIPLQPGTSVLNVRYKFIVNGVTGTEQSTGITQPTTDFAVFRINASAPEGLEEVLIYDKNDPNNWNAQPARLGIG